MTRKILTKRQGTPVKPVRGRPRKGRPPLTVARILAWADAHHMQTGRWPTVESGPVLHMPGETWMAVNQALQRGHRGLPGNSSLARLLAKERGARPPLTIRQILAWADNHHTRTGRRPSAGAGPVPGVPHENWKAIDACLRVGLRGLPGGSSLAKLLAQREPVK